MYKSLIIDDEKPVHIAIKALGSWRELGVQPPLSAENGEEGLALMRQEQPDIVFVDMQMPVMDGVEFLKRARREFPGAQFIVVSGYDEFEYARSALKYGAVDYLLKPVKQGELNSAIQKAADLLGGDNMASEEAPSLPPEQAVEEIKRYIDKNFCQDITIAQFTEKYHYSKEYLLKNFKKKYGAGIYEYANRLRMARAKELLQNSRLQIQDIAERLGYSNSNYFSKAFRKYYRVSPSDFRAERAD